MHRGSDYQAHVAAWLAVEMLAEGQGRPFSPGGRITFLRGETQESMDDLLVGTAADRYGFIQAKSKAVFSDKPDGEFASVIDQADSADHRQTSTDRADDIADPVDDVEKGTFRLRRRLPLDRLSNSGGGTVVLSDRPGGSKARCTHKGDAEHEHEFL